METLPSLYIKSTNFFNPIYTNHWINDRKSKKLQELFLENANKSYIFTDSAIIEQMDFFLKNQTNPFYENMNIQKFIQRLITQRPLSFYGHKDNYFFITDGKKYFGYDTDLEFPFLSQDEIKLSSFLQYSSPVTPLNDGRCPNDNKLNEHVESAIYIGTPYIRLDVPNRYDYYLIENSELNLVKYYARLKLILNPFFKECEKRGCDYKKDVYVHIENLINEYGLKDKKSMGKQHTVFQKVINDIINTEDFKFIKIINLNNFIDRKFIISEKVVYLKDFPFLKSNLKENKLVIVMYPMGQNSIVGNEYWVNGNKSFESSAALCSQIVQIQNPFINSNISGNNYKVY